MDIHMNTILKSVLKLSGIDITFHKEDGLGREGVACVMPQFYV